MTQSYEAHRLVMQHMSVLESAPTIVSETENKVFAAIDSKISEWVKHQDSWEGVFKYCENGETSFKPTAWPKTDKGNYVAWYTLGISESGADSIYRISSLLGAGPNEFGIFFGIIPSLMTHLYEKKAKPAPAWRNLLAKWFTEYGDSHDLIKNGFRLESETLFLPIRLDSAVLADSYPGSLNDALTPIDDALEKLREAHPAIDKFLNFSSAQIDAP